MKLEQNDGASTSSSSAELLVQVRMFGSSHNTDKSSLLLQSSISSQEVLSTSAEGCLCQQNPCRDHSPNVTLKGQQAFCYLCMWHSHPHESTVWNRSTMCCCKVWFLHNEIIAPDVSINMLCICCLIGKWFLVELQAEGVLTEEQGCLWGQHFEEDKWSEHEMSKDDRAQIHCTPVHDIGAR